MGYGWDEMEKADETAKKFGGGGSWRPEFFMQPGDRKRLLFAQDDPYCLWVHGSYKIGGDTNPVCLIRNEDLGHDACPFCDVPNKVQSNKGIWPFFVGAFTIIDLGFAKYDGDGNLTLEPFVSSDGKEYQFQRRIYVARKGSDNKPGMLVKLRNKMAHRGGGMKGVVIEATRSGKQTESIGDDVEFVERVAEKDWPKYLKGAGMSDEALQGLELDPFDFSEIYQPLSPEAMEKMLRAGGVTPASASSGSGSASGVDGVPF
tara:strand:+ start:3404 stop:4183 length:780 start_codon:yes stop_codon:yes gene_type:complete